MQAGAPSGETRRSSRLYLFVLAGVAAGVLTGVLAPSSAITLKPLGDGFVSLIKMLIGPIVFVTVTVGIAGMGDLRQVGRVGAKALVWFEVMTTVALMLGLGVVTLVGPGKGLHVDAAGLDTGALQNVLGTPRPHGFGAHLLALIPQSFVGAFVQGEVLQVLVLAVLCGVALASMKEAGRPVLLGLERIGALLFAVISVVMWLAPIGAFGAMAFTVGTYGVGALGKLALLVGCFYVTALLFVFVVLGAALAGAGLSIFKLVRYLKEELLVVLGTSSSESALPSLMTKLERLGCAEPVVRLVVPTGYSFNLDGTCIYLTMASVFVAQATDVELSLGQQLSLLAVLLLTSKGAAGVTGSGLVTLAATLESVGTVPVAGLSLLVGIDRFMSEARALTNLIGNAVATIVVSRWETALDLPRARRVLSGEVSESSEAPP